MKVLKKPNTEWSYKHTCENCEAELEVEKSDVTYKHYAGDFRESSYDTWTAFCPICSHNFHIPTDKMSKAVQVEIKNRSSVSKNVYDK